MLIESSQQKKKMRIPVAILLIILVVHSAPCAESAKKKKKSEKPSKKTSIQYQNAMAFKDLSQLDELQEAMFRQATITTTSMTNTTTSTAQVSATRQGPCTCAKGVCACCSRILLNLWKQKACVNVTYDPDEFAFTAKVSMNDQIYYTRTVSGKNPRPVCVPVPRLPVVRACIRFYNIYFQGRNVHACVNMEGKFRDTTLFKVGMDCLRLGSSGVALVKPEDGGGIGQVEILPEDPDGGSSEDDYDGYDDYDDDDDGDDDDDDDLFDY